MVPNAHRDFASQILQDHDIDTRGLYDKYGLDDLGKTNNLQVSGAKKLLDVAFSHPIKLIANALGVPPAIMLEMGKANNVAVTAYERLCVAVEE